MYINTFPFIVFFFLKDDFHLLSCCFPEVCVKPIILGSVFLPKVIWGVFSEVF